MEQNYTYTKKNNTCSVVLVAICYVPLLNRFSLLICFAFGEIV